VFESCNDHRSVMFESERFNRACVWSSLRRCNPLASMAKVLSEYNQVMSSAEIETGNYM